jgi:protocatechuate 3,4-dioxygenase beta subunit
VSLGIIVSIACAPLIAGATGAAAPQRPTPPPPDCAGGARLTPSQTEGPYYKANSPERTSLLEAGSAGMKVVVTGYVVGRDCKPVVRAWLDFWQANERGEYDNTGFKMRGHQFADANGIYYLETVLPGLYPGRTRHIHVKVRAPNGPTLTSQLYFPGEARNQSDGIFNPGLIVTMQDVAGGKVAYFNFVIETR